MDHGDILTMHKILEVVKLECEKPNGDVIEIPLDFEACVDSVKVYEEDGAYHTIGDVMENQRSDNINWIVVTKGFDYQGCHYSPGTIFEVLQDEENDNEYLSAEMHPGRLMVFLPINLKGEFYRIDSPYETKEEKLADLKAADMPLVFTPQLKTFPHPYIQNTELTNDLLIAKKKTTEKLVLATSFHDDEFYFHVFPLAVTDVFCEILLGGIPIDMLQSEELDRIEKELLPKLHHQMKYTLSLSYNNAGIERLPSPKKLKSKIKKKDIKKPIKLNDDDSYPRYTEKPTKLMKELGKNISGGHSNLPQTLMRMRTIVRKTRYPRNNNGSSNSTGSFSSNSSGDEEIKDGDFTTVSTILRKMNLEKYEEVFMSEKIDSKILSGCDEDDFLELGLERDEADRLCSSINDRSIYL